jgi:hypothetical protein
LRRPVPQFHPHRYTAVFPSPRRAMTPEQFIALWKDNPLTERAGA